MVELELWALGLLGTIPFEEQEHEDIHRRTRGSVCCRFRIRRHLDPLANRHADAQEFPFLWRRNDVGRFPGV